MNEKSVEKIMRAFGYFCFISRDGKKPYLSAAFSSEREAVEYCDKIVKNTAKAYRNSLHVFYMGKDGATYISTFNDTLRCRNNCYYAGILTDKEIAEL